MTWAADKFRTKVVLKPITRADMRAELDEYEIKYGVPSERLFDVFRDGEGRLVETPDFHSWLMLYDAWVELEEKD